jgi:hypothetical protein
MNARINWATTDFQTKGKDHFKDLGIDGGNTEFF